MKINTSTIHNYKKNSFMGGLNNKLLLKTLEFASENNAIVSAGLTLGLSTLVRPVAIMKAPKTDIGEKKIQAAKSIASGIIGFGFTSAIFTPISLALDKISSTPEQFLKNSTIKNLKGGTETLAKSKPFNFLKQILKFSPEVVTVIPKAILTAALIVPIGKMVFEKKKESPKIDYNNSMYSFGKKSNLTFKSGQKLSTKIISNIINNEKVQKVAIKAQNTNFMQHAYSLKDAFATTCFAVATSLNSSFDKDKKKSLIYNAGISTGLTISGAYITEKLLRNPVEKFTKNFIKANKYDKNLSKYLSGLKILEPLLILSSIYYVVIPVVSTFLSGRLTKISKTK